MATVLVVDDARIMRFNMIRLLEELGHEVVGEACNGHEAIMKHTSLKPDFITLDITMPHVREIEDGLSALKKIIEKDDEANIIMVTSHGEKQKVMEALRNGASGYLLKPIEKDKLSVAIEKLEL